MIYTTQNKIPCSVPILTLNSEKFLERCLESVKDFEDVYLVDGNSTDRTLEIARKYNIPVYKQVETDEPNVKITNFTEIRTRAIELGKKDWVLVLDSDEFIEDGLRQEISTAVEKNDHMTAYAFPHIAIMDEKEVHYAFNLPCTHMRLYNKRSGMRLKEHKPVHEKFLIPEGVRMESFKNNFYNEAPPYRQRIEKNKFYLSHMKEKLRNKDPRGHRKAQWRSLFSNFGRAMSILIKSIAVYKKHGFKNSMPFRDVWSYAHYHLVICVYRIQQLLTF